MPEEHGRYVAWLLTASRRGRATRRGSTAFSCWYQAVYLLVWFRERPQRGANRPWVRDLGGNTPSGDAPAPGRVPNVGLATRRTQPVKQPADGSGLDVDTRTCSMLLRSLRCLGERGLALLAGRWCTLEYVTVNLSKIGNVTQAALALARFEHSDSPC